MSEYLIQKETLNGIAAQSNALAGKTAAVSPAIIIEDLIAANDEVSSQTDLLRQIQTALTNKTIFSSITADDLSIAMGTAGIAKDSSPTTSTTGGSYISYLWEATVTVSVTIPEGATLFGLYLISEKLNTLSVAPSSGPSYGSPSIERVTNATTTDGLTYKATASTSYQYRTSSSSSVSTRYLYLRARLVALYKAAEDGVV